MIKKLFLSFFLLLLQVNIYTQALITRDIDINILTNDYINTLKVVESNINHTGRNATISIVSDGKNKYILKQIKNNDFNSQLDLIKECIVSAIGCKHGINVDKNFFIPCNVGQNIKIYKNRAATLHTYIQGISLSTTLPSSLPKDFRLSQRFRPYLYEYKHGFEIEYGFNEATIKSMSCHKDFPGIVALDTLFGNFDRDTDNIIYNENLHTFYGIDQGASFSGDLPFLSIFAYHQCIKLQKLDSFSMYTPDMIKALHAYKNYLKALCEHKSTEIIGLFEKMMPLLQSDEIKSKNKDLKILSSYLEQSYQLCLNIVDLLQTILEKIDKKTLEAPRF